ncbi:hypothetical protein CAPTEDRAFT_205794 [Capitella teleta]|uniref:Uncharacterized protein n=1 Tax=Capitella teleta TaxID=283909 RepID=R7U511_CAPTE|nr:hypothetical protein CAPTEDRAFT_205794 [Capitella teleta]|eukprot:ELU01216.1 hypothetical protein CAPTEDRAFT_205794 [Capitella teleta]
MHTVKLFDIFRDDAQEVIAPVYSKKCKTRKSPCLAEKRRLEAGRSPCNKTQQLSSFESEQEHGKRRCTPPSTLKIMTLTGLDLCPESSRWTCRCPQHIQPRKEKDLEEDASFHRPAPVVSEDED